MPLLFQISQKAFESLYAGIQGVWYKNSKLEFIVIFLGQKLSLGFKKRRRLITTTKEQILRKLLQQIASIFLT